MNQIFNNLRTANTSLLIFFLIVAGNFIADVYSCDLRRLLENNMIIKHLIAFLLLYVFVVLLELKELSPINALIISLCIYILFILTMRSPLIITIINMFLIFITYFINLNYDYYYDKERNTSGKIPFNIDKDFIKTLMLVILVTIIILTFVGFFYQLIYTRNIYSKNWTLYNFILGISNVHCLRN